MPIAEAYSKIIAHNYDYVAQELALNATLANDLERQYYYAQLSVTLPPKKSRPQRCKRATILPHIPDSSKCDQSE